MPPCKSCRSSLAAALLTLTLASLAMPAAAGKIFKWVDSKGITHYSQSPPLNQDVEEIAAQTGDAKQQAAANQRLQSQVQSLDSRREDRHAARDGTSEALARQRETEAFCNEARERVSQYNSGRRLAVEQEDGTFRRLTPEEIGERRDELKSQLDEHCNGQ